MPSLATGVGHGVQYAARAESSDPKRKSRKENLPASCCTGDAAARCGTAYFVSAFFFDLLFVALSAF